MLAGCGVESKQPPETLGGRVTCSNESFGRITNVVVRRDQSSYDDQVKRLIPGGK